MRVKKSREWGPIIEGARARADNVLALDNGERHTRQHLGRDEDDRRNINLQHEPLTNGLRGVE
jgi:hypothetical protein